MLLHFAHSCYKVATFLASSFDSFFVGSTGEGYNKKVLYGFPNYPRLQKFPWNERLTSPKGSLKTFPSAFATSN